MDAQKRTVNQNTSNLRSLRNILSINKAQLDNRRTPLSQYMNKRNNKNANNKNLSYFQKLKNKISSKQVYHKQKSQVIHTQGNILKDQNNIQVQLLKEVQLQHRQQGNIRSKSTRLSFINRTKQSQNKLLKSRRNIEKNLIQQIKTDLKKKGRAISTQNPSSYLAIKQVKVENVNYSNFETLLGSKIFSKVQLRQVLGSGASATVKLCIYKNMSYAVKIYQKYKLLQPRKKKRVYTQIQILGNLNPHQNIIQLHQAYQDKRQIHMIFQNIQGAVTLNQYFRDNMLHLQQGIIKKIFMKITKGIYHIHSQGVSHRDIKPDNILLAFDQDEDLIIKIIDFGFSTAVSKTDLQCGTPNFMAPQLTEKPKKYNPCKVDIWALGVLLFYLCEGRYPFRGFDQKELFRNLRCGNFIIKRTINEQISNLIEMCLKVNPDQRASADEILLSSWLKI